MKTEMPLFSFCILSYNNYCYIQEAIDSVFAQTYPNIELLISNDGSPDFDVAELTEYINAHKGENIRKVYINNNETNLGTVKNINHVREHASGEYIMYMAADDALYDKTVLERYVQELEKLGEDALLVSSRTAMCSDNLDEIVSYEPSEEGISAIKNMDSRQLFSRLTHTFTIPTTSTCYRMRLYDLVGPYDEDYYIIEDAPLYIKLARMGIKIHWIDGMIGARHRDGGISHGNSLGLSESYRKYRYDEIILFKKEILPYKKQILPADRVKMQQKWEYIERRYDQQFVIPNLTPKERWQRRIKHLPQILLHMLHRFFALLKSYAADREMARGAMYTALGCCLMLFIAAIFRIINGIVLFPPVVTKMFVCGFYISAALWLLVLFGRFIFILCRSVRFILLGS